MEKTPGWVWVALAVGVAFFLLRNTVDSATSKLSSPAATKNLGYGIGSGAADSLGSAAGKFFSGLFGSSTSITKSYNDAGGPVTRSSGIDWDVFPPDDAIEDDLAGPDFV
jgi:hypothetical protein